MPECLIGLGSNLGSRQEILTAAVRKLESRLDVAAVSDWFSYPAIGGPEGQGDFLNGVVRARTAMRPQQVATLLHAIEKEAGRERVVRWSARTLDCDLLLYGEEIVETASLIVPHPRMITRRFVLEPACQIAADMVHPVSGWKLEKLYEHLESARTSIAVVGPDHDFVSQLAREISHVCGIRLLEHAPLSRGDRSKVLEWAEAADVLIRETGGAAFVSNFWLGEPLLGGTEGAIGIDNLAHVSAKLVVVTEPMTSDFGQRYLAIDRRFRVPTLFLSSDRQRAIQDATGSISAME